MLVHKVGLVPENFTKGILVPALKKATLDPSLAGSYRPIIISVVLSKLLDLHILDQCKNHELSGAQFGFIEGRGTGMATAMAHDVGSYCVTNGSSVFYMSLDAEGAFDSLPHSFIMQKCIGVLPDDLWFLVCNCYKNICTRV